MPGICGFAESTPGSDPAALLGTMLGRMSHDPDYRVCRYTAAGGGGAFGSLSLGPAAAGGTAGTNVVVLAGEIYDDAGFRRAGESVPAMLLRGHAAEGPAFFRRLNGKFAAALWDAPARRLILVNDRFGMKPLYY